MIIGAQALIFPPLNVLDDRTAPHRFSVPPLLSLTQTSYPTFAFLARTQPSTIIPFSSSWAFLALPEHTHGSAMHCIAFSKGVLWFITHNFLDQGAPLGWGSLFWMRIMHGMDEEYDYHDMIGLDIIRENLGELGFV